MRYSRKKYILGISGILLSVSACTNFLDETVFGEYDSTTFLQEEASLVAVLNGAYSTIQLVRDKQRNIHIVMGELPTDITLESGGGLELTAIPYMRFSWDPSLPFFDDLYGEFYSAIARSNVLLSQLEKAEEIREERKEELRGEARFIRAYAYYMLHNHFGPTPILEIPDGATLEEVERIGKETPKATEEAYRAYVEADLLFAIGVLPETGFASRANKGNARALLCKFYLNNKEWSKAAETAQQVIDMGYSLHDDYMTMFSVAGENNSEVIFKFECKVGTVLFNNYIGHAFPANYPVQSNWVNFGAHFRTLTAFFETFGPEDVRRALFLTSYIPIGQSNPVFLNRDEQGNALNNVRSFKYTPDPNAAGPQHGNDVVAIRLADIMLALAEALNELEGVNTQTIDLINAIRARAGATSIDLTDFPSKESLRDFILAERGREFFTEGLRREDLIRHDKFIQFAVDRGINALPHHVLYPLPQAQIDNNPKLVQNAGY